MTDYRVHGVYVDAVTKQIELGLFVGKSDRLRSLYVTDDEAWRIALGLLEALRDHR